MLHDLRLTRAGGTRQYWGILVLFIAFLALYAGVLRDLVRHWTRDENYSHGFIIIPAALYLVWDRRERLKALPVQPSWSGAAIVAASLGVLMIGTAGIEFFLTRISMIGVLAGVIVCLLGWAWLRALAFPVALLLLMIPLPELIFNQVAFPLQLVASQFGVAVLRAGAVPVFREGNVIALASTTLEVAEACSGIRSLLSLMTVALLWGYVAEPRIVMRTLIALATIPVAVVTNGLRVAGTGFAAHYLGPAAATGFLHEFSGLMVFAASLLMVVAFERCLHLLGPSRRVAVAGINGTSV